MNEPALILKEGFVQDARALFEDLRRTVVWDERMRARKTASFGVAYNYSGMTYPDVAMRPDLEVIARAVEREVGLRPNNCLLNLYPDGRSTMGFHSDADDQLADGTGVSIVSLGASRAIVYRHKTSRGVERRLTLKEGSLLHMAPTVQEEWLHAIPPEPGAGERISLTFRSIVRR